MADLTLTEAISFFLDETTDSVDVPNRFRYMQELWIQTRISQRLPETGKIRVDMPIPRIWTGYYYLLSDNCIFKYGAIEFQNQEIYRARNFSWNSEIATNENSFNLSTPEFPIDVDGIDEAAESDLWLSTDPKNYYLPTQLPIDKIKLYVPVGCQVEVNICGLKFSPVSVAGIDNDIDIYEDADADGEPDVLLPTPDNPFQFPELSLSDLVVDFEPIALSRGYLPIGALPQNCSDIGYSSPDELIAAVEEATVSATALAIENYSIENFATFEAIVDLYSDGELFGRKYICFRCPASSPPVFIGTACQPAGVVYLGSAVGGYTSPVNCGQSATPVITLRYDVTPYCYARFSVMGQTIDRVHGYVESGSINFVSLSRIC